MTFWISHELSLQVPNGPLKVVSLNVKGFNSSHKQKITFNYFHSLKAKVTCLQETHFSTTSTPKYFSPYFPHVFMASDKTKHRGVLIVLHSNTQFPCAKEIKGLRCRFLLLVENILDQPIMIVSTMPPTPRRAHFLKQLLHVVSHHMHGALLVCRDSSLTLFPSVDNSTGGSFSSEQSWFGPTLLEQHGLTPVGSK